MFNIFFCVVFQIFCGVLYICQSLVVPISLCCVLMFLDPPPEEKFCGTDSVLAHVCVCDCAWTPPYLI